MIYYFIPILIGLLLSFYEVKSGESFIIKHTTRNLFVLFAAIIFCGGYMTGSDWVNYELIYNDATFSKVDYFNREKGFYYFMLIFKELGFGFFPFLIINKLFVFYVLANFLKKQFNSFFLPFTIFLTTDALFLFVDNPLRFMIAFGFVILSYDYLLKRKFIPFLLLIIAASTFHITSIIMILIYFGSTMKIYKKHIVILVYFFIYISLSPSLISQYIERYYPDLSIVLGSYYERMTDQQFTLFSIGRFIFFVFFVFIVINRLKIINYKKSGILIYSFTIIYFYVSIIGWVIPTFFRVGLYLVPFFYISLSIILLSKFRLQKQARMFFVVYLVLSTFKNIYSTYVYIPYTNYFTSLFQNEYPYSYRKNYNIIKYHERTGSWPDQEN